MLKSLKHALPWENQFPLIHESYMLFFFPQGTSNLLICLFYLLIYFSEVGQVFGKRPNRGVTQRSFSPHEDIKKWRQITDYHSLQVLLQWHFQIA
jgi:hypothetical protein